MDVMTPPKTKRWCPRCEKFRMFEYVKNIGHSECTECGSRFGRKAIPKEQFPIEVYGWMCWCGKIYKRRKPAENCNHGEKESIYEE